MFQKFRPLIIEDWRKRTTFSEGFLGANPVNVEHLSGTCVWEWCLGEDSQLAMVRVMENSWNLSVSVGFLRSSVHSFVSGSWKVAVDAVLCTVSSPVRNQLIRLV